jgi:hypothetical protein
MSFWFGSGLLIISAIPLTPQRCITSAPLRDLTLRNSFAFEPARPQVQDYVPETRPPATTYSGAYLLPDPD